MKQPPEKNDAKTTSEKVLHKGVGYTAIFKSGMRKYELSTQMTILRKTKYSKSGSNEILFERIKDSEEMSNVERISERWELYGTGPAYYILEQFNAKDKPTGYIKIVQINKANKGFFSNNVDAKQEDYTYFKRRTNK